MSIDQVIKGLLMDILVIVNSNQIINETTVHCSKV